MNINAKRYVLIIVASMFSAVGLAGEGPTRRSPIVNFDGRGGVIPHPADMSHLAKSYIALERRHGTMRDTLPARWDSREHGWITSIKNQGDYGTCWAHSALASLETALKKNGDTDNGADWDFSENHLANHDVGFGPGYEDGGNNAIATALLTSWRDPIRESDDPYGHPESVVDIPAVKHVQNVVWLPENKSAGDEMTAIRDIDEIYKRAVMEYGAVSISYFHCQKACKDSTTHYLPSYNDDYVNSKTDGGHAVTLIGWDDNYPAANFKYTPPGNGAFLCKNSWGTDKGDNGCLWISYYDACIFSNQGAAFPKPDAPDNYGRIYEYDPCGYVAGCDVYEDDDIPGSKTNWCANVFTAEASGVIDAVGFYSLSAGTEYEIRVFTGCTATPNSGTLVSRQTGSINHAGYATVKLAQPAALSARGEKFAIVMKLECPYFDYPIPVEMSKSENNVVYCTTTAHRGESFLSGDGETWTDFHDMSFSNGDENICIKAYTKAGEDGEVITSTWYVDVTSSAVEPDGSEENPFATIADAVNVSVNGDVVLVKPGIYHETFVTSPRLAEIRSTDGHEVTIIDGDGERRCYDGSNDPDTILYGFTLRNGFDNEYGGGAYNGSLSHCVISNCVVCSDGESDKIYGGGAYMCSCGNTLIVKNRTYFENGTAYGGGAANSLLVNCTVADNVVGGNHAYGGGAVNCSAYNTIIALNGFCGNGKILSGENTFWGGGNRVVKAFVDGDPLFVDHEHGDYRLAAGSQCIDAGFYQALDDHGMPDETDLADEDRVAGWEVDIGCYEYSQDVWFRDWTIYDSYACQTNELVISADGQWTLLTDDSWLTPLVDQGIGCATVKVEIAANDIGTCRSGAIYLYGAGANWVDWCDIVQGRRTSRGGKHFGLFVGVNTYDPQRNVNPLEGCVNDAMHMREQAITSGLWHADDTTIATNNTATLLVIRTNIEVYAAVAEPGDTFMYYHSGHGGSGYRENYANTELLTYDGDYWDFQLAEDLALFKEGVKIIVITDTCHSGGLFKDYVWTRPEHTIAERMSELISGPAFITAADLDQYSWDDGEYADGSSGGCFTSALISGWRTGDADLDGDGKLNFLELAEYAAPMAVGYPDDLVDYWTQSQRWNEPLLAEMLAGYVPGVWPDPEIKPDDSLSTKAMKVHDALVGAGFADDVADAVTDEAQYNAIVDWNTANNIGVEEQASSPTALLSPALGVNELLDISSEDVVIAEFRKAANGNSYAMNVSIDSYDAQKANELLLKAAVGVVGATEPDGTFTGEGLVYEVSPGGESVEIELAPPDESSTYFFRAIVR